jgi:hypothetical protein
MSTLAGLPVREQPDPPVAIRSGATGRQGRQHRPPSCGEPTATTSRSRREKAWAWIQALLPHMGPEGASVDLLEILLREVGLHDPCELINDWSGGDHPRLKPVNCAHGDSRRRFVLADPTEGGAS